MNKYEKFAIYLDWKRNIKTFKDYKKMLEHIPFEYLKYRCLKEMYARSQPSANLDDLLKEHFDRIDKCLEPERFYERYYLSYQECKYILDKYVKEWFLKDPWDDYFDLLIYDAENKHVKDKWIPERVDKHGNVHPGYRSYEDVMPLKDIIGNDNANKVIEFLKDRKSFYHHNQNESAFRAQICLGISPNSNATKVIEYWRNAGLDKDVVTDLRIHSDNYFWCEEHGYSKAELKDIEEDEKKKKEKENAC